MSENETSEPRRKRIDLSGFAPSPVSVDPGLKTQAARIAKETGFTTRHGASEADRPSDTQEITRRGRKRSTGRNTQFTVKLKPDTNNAIYELAEQLNASALAEVIERAVEALQEKLAAERRD